MAVLHDWICLAHGKFESFDGRCPHGCDEAFVAKTYVQAPGLRSDRTKNIDRTFQQLASDYGLTDMNNQNGTGAVKRPDPYKEKQRAELMGQLGDTSHLWGTVNPGGTYQVGKGVVSEGRPGNGAVGSIQSMGALPGNVLSDMALSAPVPQVVARYDAKIDTGVAP